MKLKVSSKILAVVMAISTAGMAAIGWVGIKRSSAALFAQASESLESMRVARGNTIARRLRRTFAQTHAVAQSPGVRQAANLLGAEFQKLNGQTLSAEAKAGLAAYYEKEFQPRLVAGGGTWRGLGAVMDLPPAGLVLQQAYVAANTNAVGQKGETVAPGQLVDYDAIHSRLHPFFLETVESLGYYDLFVFDDAGNLVYTVHKETDFATNIETGPYRDSGLAEAFRRAAKLDVKSGVAVVDFKPYEPSYHAPAAFAAAPIFQGNDRIGVLAVQLSIDDINAIMTEESGLGSTGESYLVGPDKLMRTDSRFFADSTLLKRTVDTTSVDSALAGDTGTLETVDYRGIPVLSSYGSLNVPELDWVVLAEKDIAEIDHPIVELRNQLIRMILFGILATAGLMLIAMRKVVLNPLTRLTEGAQRLRHGEYAARIELRSGDEFGDLGRTFNEMSESIEQDIREREETADQLHVANEQAQAATAAKSSFLATMSHEIRTPMNSIINMTQLALDTELTAKQRQYLKVVSSSSRGLLALINDILDYSKVEAGKMELEQVPFSLRKLFEEVTDSFRGRVLEKKLEFIVHVEPDVPDSIVGDTLRIRQVLINLVGNAFKFTEQGEVVVRVHLEEKAATTGRVSLRFSVKDSGIGIPKEKQAALFESFSQVDTSHSRKYGGTGLGLAISLKLVELMGGRMQVESEPGQGTTFYFIADFDCSDRLVPREIPDSIREVHTLVVDDNESSRELMQTLLEQFEMKCELAPSGLEALRLIREANVDKTTDRPFDLVLMDWLMPGMDGLEALRELRRQPATSNLPVVMVSAFATREEEERASLLGCRSLLHKPITGSHLFDSVAQIFDDAYTAQTRFVKRSAAAAEAANQELLNGVHILMAEDNDANQMVARELLESVGIRLDIADNGRIALDKLAAENDYALVLMDMQMPEMDGLTATEEIRKRWPDRKIPIIALTANAMKGDMERCLEAGMDDYVSKPIDRDQLFGALREWVPEDAQRLPVGVSEDATPSEDEIPTLAGIDIDNALQRLGLPWTSIKKMLLRFADGQPAVLKDLREAIDAQDWEAARRHAHSIAGAGGNLSAIELRNRAKALELAIKDEQGDYEPLFSTMNEELNRVLAAIISIRPAETATVATGKPVDQAALAAVLRELKDILDEGDVESIDSGLKALAEQGIPDDLNEAVQAVKRLIDEYNYFDAAERVDEALKQLGGNFE